MFATRKSIRGKITFGYALSVLFLLLVVSVLFVNLLVIEERFAFSSVISRFLDATLEMRRYEKNYFLYGQSGDLHSAIQFADTANRLLQDNRSNIASSPLHHRCMVLFRDETMKIDLAELQPERTSRLLELYRTQLSAIENRPETAKLKAAEIRETGRQITRIAELLSELERKNIAELLTSARRSLIVVAAVFVIGTALTVRFVIQTAIRPLRDLESGMRRIASGDFEMLPEEAGPGEIRSLNRAFNRMIREIFEHRQEILRSEKLASLGTLLAGIAHEINNPLSNISTSAEILREEMETAGPEHRRELVEQVLSETDRATEIIRTVLNLSRERRFDPRPMHVDVIIDKTLTLVRVEMPSHVEVKLDLQPGLTVLADAPKLQQALLNVVKNAADAMATVSGPAILRIASAPVETGEVEITISDTGPGIPEKILPRVFDPFFSTKDVGKGTGLGLYLAHQIVEQHGGAIRLDSTPGEGTTVTIRLPSGGKDDRRQDASGKASRGRRRTDRA